MLNATRCPIGALLLTAFDVKSVVNNKSFLQKVRHLSHLSRDLMFQEFNQ